MNGEKVKVGVCIYAADMVRMVEFYRDKLGFKTKWKSEDNFAEFQTASGELSFFMYSRQAFAEAIGENYIPPKGINQTFEIAFWLPTFTDVDVEYNRLSGLGVPFPTGEPMTFSFGIRNFYVADPEGNLIEIGSAKE
ncbi:MAG: VOC family protein [Vallitaleaceae bacterium]|nr:VOC family protein [Vallitaleaceae bacterium]